MEYSHPVASDFYHPLFGDMLARLGHPFQMHRKLWEYAYIDFQLRKLKKISPGTRGLCFGVGQEKLPAIFAASGCKIMATDAPPEIGEHWAGSKEYGRDVMDLNYDGVISPDEFKKLVQYQNVDMNNIGEELAEYDFCWSACCLEHLGSLKLGLDFIKNSISTLRVGGVACHTTELNLSSNTETVETGGTVLYRLADLQTFEAEIQAMGHEMQPLRIAAPASPVDHHIDVPPYQHNPHLKLLLEGYVSTSVGITIVRRK